MAEKTLKYVDRSAFVELSRDKAVTAAMDMVDGWLAQAPADEKLRMLFQLEATLYTRMGPASKEYEGGPHAKHRLIRYCDFFIERLEAGERVLDVGCSQGELSKAMAEGADVTVLGCELIPERVETARQVNDHPNVEYLAGDVLTDLPDEPFDTVVMSNVLEHLPGRVEFLKRLQASSGAKRFLIRVPQFDRDWRVPLKKELGVEWRLDATHELEYTEAVLREELEAAGLTVTEALFKWGEIYVVAERII